MDKVLLIICGSFYALLCVFSIVTGLLYAGGKKELNPLELSDRFLARYADPEKRAHMGAYGRNRILNELSWEKTSKALLEGYEKFFTGQFD